MHSNESTSADGINVSMVIMVIENDPWSQGNTDNVAESGNNLCDKNVDDNNILCNHQTCKQGNPFSTDTGCFIWILL